jgi:cytosine/creatinine deaminase
MTRHRDLVIPPGDYVVANARVPQACLAAPVDGAMADDDGGLLVDMRIVGGHIAAVAPAGKIVSAPVVDVEARLVWPALVDMHTHLDKGEAIARVIPDGTLATGADGTAADRAFWTHEDLFARMEFGLRCAYGYGVCAIRTHLDSNNERSATSWAVFQELRDAWRGRVLLQGVALAPLDYFLTDAGVRLADRVAQIGGVLGGVTDGIGADWSDAGQRAGAALDRFLALAAQRGLDVDIHTDQTADPAAFALPAIAEAVMARKFAHKVVCGHCVNLALQPDEVIAHTVALVRDAGLGIVTLPAPMMYLQDRTAGRTPRWRGVTAALELQAAGVPVAIAGDNCRDAWFAYGDHDMVETFREAVRVLHLDHPIAASPAMVARVPAALMGTPEVGAIGPGQAADLILFSARTLNELMCRVQADRIVLRGGRAIGDCVPDYAELDAVLARRLVPA